MTSLSHALDARFNREHVGRFLSYLFDPDQIAPLGTLANPSGIVVELRIPNADWLNGLIVRPTRFPKTLAGWYTEPRKLLSDLQTVSGVNAFVTANPVTSDLLGRANNRIIALKTGQGTTDSQIMRLGNLFIDFDRIKAKGTADLSATDAELAPVLATRDRFFADHPEMLASAIHGCSGNGAWALVRLPDLPNDATHENYVRQTLLLLGRNYGSVDQGVEIDPKVSNPARILGIAGLRKSKGDHTADRPHRMATIDTPPGHRRTPLDLLAWLKAHDDGEVDFEPPAATVPASMQHNGGANRGAVSLAGWQPAPLDVTVRAASLLRKIEPSVSGQHGHDRAIEAACALVKGFNLTPGQARPFFDSWNAGCQPPWQDHEICHKLEEADRNIPDSEPRGYYLNGSRDGGAFVPKYTGGASGAAKRVDVPLPDPTVAVRTNFEGGLAGDGGGDGDKNGDAVAGNSAAQLEPATSASTGPQTTAAMPTPTGRPALDTPLQIARLIVRDYFDHPDTCRLKYWQEEFHFWNGRYWSPIPRREMESIVNQAMSVYFERDHQLAMIEFMMGGNNDGDGDKKHAKPPKPRPVTVSSVRDTLQALGGLPDILLQIADVRQQPAWIGSLADNQHHPMQPARDASIAWPIGETLATRDALIHLPTLAANLDSGDVAIMEPTPRFFSRFTLPYSFDINAPEPTHWLRFLESAWGGDYESIQLLQEWMGYLLTPDTSRHKMMMLIGPPRSGKGTISRVIEKLCGPENCASPTVDSLSEGFGLESLIGKTVVTFSDVRIGPKTDKAKLVGKLLALSGEDSQVIQRKYRADVTTTLRGRVMWVSNELPAITDTSEAFSSRFVMLVMKKSFLGKEDTHLEERLLAELPGIFRWAVEGWSRLRKNNRFTEPRASRPMKVDLESGSAPFNQYVREYVRLDKDGAERSSEMYEHYKKWHEAEGFKSEFCENEVWFGRKLTTKYAGVSKKRLWTDETSSPNGVGGSKIRTMHYVGLRLLNEAERAAALDREEDEREEWEEDIAEREAERDGLRVVGCEDLGNGNGDASGDDGKKDFDWACGK